MQEPIHESFYVDFGASTCVNNLGKLSFIKPYQGRDKVYVGDSIGLSISHIWDIMNNKIHLKDVLVVLKLKNNLLSIGKFTSIPLAHLNLRHLIFW